MKKYWLSLLVCLATCATLRADTITLWDFNFPEVPIGTFGGGDANPVTGSWTPNLGSGTITNIGGTTNIFGNPPVGGSTATSDGDVSDNSAVRLGLFPAEAANNKTAGIQAFISTAGYDNIQVAYDQENSATASKYWRVQYSIDGGANWIDYTVYTGAGSTSWVLQRVIDFTGVAGVRDNPNFGFRLVSEFESTATGSGTAGYLSQQGGIATGTGGYSTGGTLWIDMFTVSGTTISGTANTPPTISVITGQEIGANQTVGPIAFTVADAETPADQLMVTATSANQTLVQDSDITLGGSGGNRTISIHPEPNQFGPVQVTVKVTDGGGSSASTLLNVTIDQPSIIVSNQTVRINNSATATVQITGASSFLGTVNVTADSTNTSLLPDSNINILGSGSTYNVTLTPALDQTGVSFVTLTASDGAITVTNSFYLHVVPTNTIALWDFNSEVFDANANTVSTNPVIGMGLATSCGTATNSLGSLTAQSADPETLDNTKWRFGAFPAATAGNKTSGAEIHVDTTGYQNIGLSFDHYNSATASRFWRIQYSLDGINYTDFNGYSNTLATTWFTTNFTFGAIAGANNNPNFAVRIVSEFQSTASGTTTNAYTAVSGSYSSGGTLWLDDINFTGDPYVAGANTPPTITAIPNQTGAANQVIGPISVTINDAQTAAGQLTLSGTSDTPSLIANSDITFGGTDANRTITIHPEANQTGSAQITVTVSDGNGGSTPVTFTVTVQAPSLVILNQTIRVNNSATVQLDVSSFLGTPTITTDSSNTTILPNENIVITGSGATRTITFTPAQDQVGATFIRFLATDGNLSASNAFYLHVVPTNVVALWDFNSPTFDANMNTGTTSPAIGTGSARSAGVATNSFGTVGTSTDPETLDNTKWRFGAFPAATVGNKTAGAEFHVDTTGYQNIGLSFDHYNSGTASRYWRVQYSLDGTTYTDFDGYANTLLTTFFSTNFDLSSIAGANNNPNFAVRIVSEFESTATGAGSDAYLGVSSGYGSGGTLWLDDITFTGSPAAVTTLPTLAITTGGGNLQISWPAGATGASLQSTISLNPPNWQTVAQSPVLTGDQNVVTISMPASGNQFFRLVH